jgi:hypothetical protein
MSAGGGHNLRPRTKLEPPFPWHQGEHLTIIGSNGSGKTFLLSRLLVEGPRRFVIMVRTKADDTRLPAAFKRTTDPGILDDPRVERVLFDVTRRQRNEQAALIAALMSKVWEQTGWTLAIDEGFYVYDRLGLGDELETLLTQGRGMGITVVTGIQRPVRVSRFILSESMHVVAFDLERRDRRTLEDSTGELLADAAVELRRFQFAWWARKARQVWVGKVQELEDRTNDEGSLAYRNRLRRPDDTGRDHRPERLATGHG